MELKNKTAVITGARQGIGKGIALALAEEGYNIVISDIDQKGCEKVCAELKNSGVKTAAIKCDIAKPRDVANLFKKTAKQFGKIDILVNNAGIFPFVPFEKMKESDWEKVININLKSVFLTSKEVLHYMPQGGRIINISSIAAFVGFEGLVHYCASKGGINAMIRALALELAPKKITVNAVAPGAINTPGAKSNDEQKQQTISVIPLKRMGEPADIANAVVFFASDKSDYVTGQTLIVDGGWTLR